MIYRLHRKFLKAYKKLSFKLKDVAQERLVLFENDPFAPELNNHALSGKYQGYRSINVTGDYRAVYKVISETEVVFVLIGTHSQLYDR